ncbi:MAG: HNH endonuclease signature motif containing protein, partial [Actinomycetota bacterium]
VVGEDDTDLIDICWRNSVDGLARLATRRHRLTRDQQREAFDHRYVIAQPNLDQSEWKVHARLPAMAGRSLVDALDAKADELPNDIPASRPTKWADALWAISADSLAGTDGATIESQTPLLTVFMDANDAAPSNGEAGVWIEAGPRAGIDTLEAILCTGAVEVTARTKNATPLDMGRRTRVIPPRLRRFVLARDDGCTIAGCTSRYRLQTHHILPWSQGGPTDAGNLATICWYHHHIAIHGKGFTIDPDSPPQRRRLNRPPIHAPPPW